jgi:hypothetical protein
MDTSKTSANNSARITDFIQSRGIVDANNPAACANNSAAKSNSNAIQISRNSTPPNTSGNISHGAIVTNNVAARTMCTNDLPKTMPNERNSVR